MLVDMNIDLLHLLSSNIKCKSLWSCSRAAGQRQTFCSKYEWFPFTYLDFGLSIQHFEVGRDGVPQLLNKKMKNSKSECMIQEID